MNEPSKIYGERFGVKHCFVQREVKSQEKKPFLLAKHNIAWSDIMTPMVKGISEDWECPLSAYSQTMCSHRAGKNQQGSTAHSRERNKRQNTLVCMKEGLTISTTSE